jgi:hypothetical protein
MAAAPPASHKGKAGIRNAGGKDNNASANTNAKAVNATAKAIVIKTVMIRRRATVERTRAISAWAGDDVVCLVIIKSLHDGDGAATIHWPVSQRTATATMAS